VIVAVVVVLTLALTGALVGCSSDSAAPVPSDPVLASGQQVYEAHCQSCHGSKGQGGTGMKLAGKVSTDFPDIADQIAVIENGRGSMPAWKNKLSAEEIAAVARYTRECLGTTC
jgi:mono/diheme cytochrome c family protein